MGFDITIPGATQQLQFIASTTTTANAATVTFNNIPTGYKWLFFYANFKTDISRTVDMRLNNDAGANYDEQYLQVAAGAHGGAQSIGATKLISGGDGYDSGGFIRGWICNLAAQKKHGRIDVGATTICNYKYARWNDVVNEISRVDFFCEAGNFVDGSYFAIYGMTL